MSHPAVAPRTYLLVFGALILLTFTTYTLSGQKLGAWDVPVALGIATAKTVLVGLFFMHLLHSSRLTWLVVGTGVLFLGILLVLTGADYGTRDWLTEKAPTRTEGRAGVTPAEPGR
jgi:cytochrome c oxidase subunit 4